MFLFILTKHSCNLNIKTSYKTLKKFVFLINRPAGSDENKQTDQKANILRCFPDGLRYHCSGKYAKIFENLAARLCNIHQEIKSVTGGKHFEESGSSTKMGAVSASLSDDAAEGRLSFYQQLYTHGGNSCCLQKVQRE